MASTSGLSIERENLAFTLICSGIQPKSVPRWENLLEDTTLPLSLTGEQRARKIMELVGVERVITCYTVVELKSFCSVHKLSRYSKMNRAELITFLENHFSGKPMPAKNLNLIPAPAVIQAPPREPPQTSQGQILADFLARETGKPPQNFYPTADRLAAYAVLLTSPQNSEESGCSAPMDIYKVFVELLRQ